MEVFNPSHLQIPREGIDPPSILTTSSDEFIVGIDPSFTSTGMALLRATSFGEASIVDTYRISSVETKGHNYDITNTMYASAYIAEAIKVRVERWKQDYLVSAVSIEYPVLATRSGAYLGLIQQALYSLYPSIEVPVYGLSSMAIKALVKQTTKSELVDWCKESIKWECETIHKGRWCINHDECSAAVLALICHLWRIQKYKKTVKTFYNPWQRNQDTLHSSR